MRSAIERLKARIVDLQDLDLTKIVDRTDEVIHPVQAKIRATIASIYGEDTTDFVRLRPATHIDHTEYVITFGESRRYGADELREGVDRGRKKAVALLEGEIQALSETLQYTSGVGIDSGVGPIVPATPQNDEIFIVHGHDDAAKTEVALFVERAGLKPIILHEQPNQGRTIIEKFEKHGATASFAIIILTPDDVGGVSADQLAPRARQNVIGEMFWFAAKLGRSRVCALRKGSLELPSDFAGVGYTDMDERGAWKAELLRELEAAEYKVNWSNAMR